MKASNDNKNRKLKLAIELIPQSSWNQNLRKLIPKKGWDKIRKSVYKKFNHKCAICHTKNSKLHCHEVWNYNDKEHIQSLKGFLALCNLCHSTKHIGFAGLQSSQGGTDFEKVIKHFMKVNRVNRETFQNHYKKASEIWKERSRYEWTLYLSSAKELNKTSSTHY